MTETEYNQLVLDLANESEDTLYFMFRNSVRQIKFTSPYDNEYQYIVKRHSAICEAFKAKTGHGIMEDVDD